MRINEILTESYDDDLVSAIQDLITLAMSKDIKKISTDKFSKILAKQGFQTSTDELIAAVDASGYASSVDDQYIVPANELSADVDTDAEDTVDVGDLAGGQAMKDIKADL